MHFGHRTIKKTKSKNISVVPSVCVDGVIVSLSITLTRALFCRGPLFVSFLPVLERRVTLYRRTIEPLCAN